MADLRCPLEATRYEILDKLIPGTRGKFNGGYAGQRQRVCHAHSALGIFDDLRLDLIDENGFSWHAEPPSHEPMIAESTIRQLETCAREAGSRFAKYSHAVKLDIEVT